MKAVIGGTPVLIGQAQEEEDILMDIAVPDAIDQIADQAKIGASNAVASIQHEGFKTGVITTLFATWAGAAIGRYAVKESGEGPMWGAMLGGLAAAGFALLRKV